MAISGINYVEGGTFPDPPATETTPTYSHSMTLVIGSYSMDTNGIDTTKKNLSSENTISVRSYYTVDTDEAALKDFPLTIESLTQLISTRRARTVEAEIEPMATTIQERNQVLEELGVALGQISAGLAWWEEDRASNDWYDSQELKDTLDTHFTDAELSDVYTPGYARDAKWDEVELRKANALVKSRVDKLNNEAQTDMSRMETLVSKRDESFSLATDLTSTISDGRTSMINNMGG